MSMLRDLDKDCKTLEAEPNIWNNLSDPPHGDCIPLDGKYLVAGVL
jgi:hypothetical protein